jgi:hypothetical protein
MSLKVYDPDSVAIVAFGIPITGYADGTFISVEFNEDFFTLSVGTSGDACRAKSNNKSARVTLTLMQSSASNDLLTAVMAADLVSPNGDGIGPFIMKDNTGRTAYTAQNMWIVKAPTVDFSREVGSREWVFETDAMIAYVGGNN